MINHRGLWLPDGEQHLQQWIDKVDRVVDGKPTYQYHKLERALAEVRDFRVAVDVGAHCGLWSMHLVRRFDNVLAFEPVLAHRECFTQNVRGGNYALFDVALGAEAGECQIHTEPTSSGDSYPQPGTGTHVIAFDDQHKRDDVGFVKLDCEGFELFALQGMTETITASRPVVMVEQKPGKAAKFGLGDTDAVDYLERLGMRLVCAMSGDYLLTW